MARVCDIDGFPVILDEFESPLAHVAVVVKAGSACETVPGTAHFLEHMFFKGTKGKTNAEINGEIAAIGDQNGATWQDKTSYYINTTGPNVEKAFGVLLEMLFQPRFDPDDFERERTVIIEEIRSRSDDGLTYLFEHATARFQGDVGHPIAGDLDTIEKTITLDDVKGFRDRFYGRGNLVFIFSGRVPDESRIESLIERYAPKESIPEADVPDGPLDYGTLESPTVFSAQHPSEQAQVVLWLPCRSLQEDKDRNFSFAVTRDLLGGGMHSLFFQKIRVDEGLAYATGLFGDTYKNQCTALAYASTDPKNATKASSRMVDLIRQVAAGDFSDKLMEASLSHTLYRLASAASTPAARVGSFYRDAAYLDGFDLETYGYEFIQGELLGARAVLRERIQDDAKKMLEGLCVSYLNLPAQD